ncbi:Ig-like domain-containing protein [Pyxidicoccus xibeiensis]|uniref:Ig-like domain-containing protein n=1 Tax=Pyxidicoccus xibeiensis TaxID=2906759 RepID=UPI0020A800E3|nr:Ig-like domain-containing protein [Pyxidicoccus xibeiensis]MCP3137647.1 Ig-like domain-containing protein [Pyxidicoccus xibeiensis]
MSWLLLTTGPLVIATACGGHPDDPPPVDAGCLVSAAGSDCVSGPPVECAVERPAAEGGSPVASGAGDSDAPALMRIHPCSGAVGVDVHPTVRIEFTKEVDGASLTAATFVLLREGQPVEGEVETQGTTATFRPREKLALEQPYEVLVTSGVRGIDGSTQGSEYRWSFTVRSGLWVAPIPLETDDRGSAYDPQLVADAQGNVVAAWMQYDGSHTNLYSRRYDAVTGWAGQRTIGEERGSATRFSLAMNARGEALVLWTQWYQSLSRLWTSRSSQTTQWTAPAVLEPEASQSASPGLAIDRHGNGMAIWLRGSAPAHLWSGQYLNNVGWVEVHASAPLDIGGAEEPQVASDGFGNITVVWLQREGTQKAIWMRRFAPDIGWGDVQRMKHAESLNAITPRLSVDASGTATIVWLSVGSQQVCASRYMPGVGWEAVHCFSQGGGQLAGLAIAGEAGGRVMAVWEQHQSPRVSAWTARYVAGSGWVGARSLGAPEIERSQEPAIAMDGNGNAVAAWFQIHGAVPQLWAARYTPATDWGARVRLDTSGNAIRPRVVMDSSGRATVVWSQYIGNNFDLWTSRFE